MITLNECYRNNTCYDCDNEECGHHGDKGADCPKYYCDNPKGLQDCEHCEFIDQFIADMRIEYQKRGAKNEKESGRAEPEHQSD